MQVLIISNLFPNKLEPNRATFNARQFAELGRSVAISVIAPVAWTERRRLRREQGEDIPMIEDHTGIRVLHPTYWYTPGFLRPLYGLFFFGSVLASVRREIKARRPDVILATWAYPDGFAAVLLGKLFGLPVAIKVHGSDIHSLEGRMRKSLTRWALRRAKAVISVSEDLATRMAAMGVARSDIRVIYNGVDRHQMPPSDQARYSRERQQSKLLFVGNLVAIKNVDVLLRAVAILSRPDLRLDIIGRGPDRNRLQLLTRELGLEEQVTFHGSRPHSEIPAAMCAADLLILPSRNEGVPNVILEALSVGLPVVASEVGGIPEILPRSAGILVAPGDEQALATGIGHALATEWQAAELIGHAARFDWQDNAQKLRAVLEEVVAGQSPD